jgi:hypothetical protein
MTTPEFRNWHPLIDLALTKLPHHGAIPAVYAMRRSRTGEIVYIGSTDNLRRRIFGNYLGGVGGGTTKRINALLFNHGEVVGIELAWLETQLYEDKETELKERYRSTHGRLPVWALR